MTVPPFRVDAKLPADLVEDIIRTVGYDRLPSTTLDGPLPEPTPNPLYEREARLRQVMTGCGFAEIIAYTLTSRREAGPFPPADADNPLAVAVSERLVPTVEGRSGSTIRSLPSWRSCGRPRSAVCSII